MDLTRDRAIDRALATLLDSLAHLLISIDVTPARLAQITRASFVKAGAAKSRKRSSGRPHLAKIAAVTALSRAEVKRIVSSNYSSSSADPESWPRALRVLSAWHKSKRFQRNGKPLRLKLHGKRESFEELCKLHSGDIPPRVILAELQRIGRVILSPDGSHARVVPGVDRSRQYRAAESSLAFAASLLDCALNEDLLLVKRKQLITAPDEIPGPYVDDAISSRVNELLDGMPALFPRSKTRRRKRVKVFALVARELG